MKWSTQSNWIWPQKEQGKDSYGEFVSDFIYNGGEIIVKISVDSNYTMFINGRYVASEQYPDFPHYKVYDEIDLSGYCIEGSNRIAILVWYYGENFMTYYVGKAALRFEVCCNGEILTCSDKTTYSRMSKSYQNGLCLTLTPQLGYSYCYDATKEDDWKIKNHTGFSHSHIVEQTLPLFKRNIKKTVIGEKSQTRVIRKADNYYLYDIGYEEVGYLTLKVKSACRQKIKICYGEHIDDGVVRSVLPWRNFYFNIIVGDGITEYTNYMRRLGCRYLEIYSERPLEIEYLSVLPCTYPLNKITKKFNNPLHQKIYDVCVRTLELCLHEHYEDCPWREQGLYAMDSRNQMLCGYYAFKEYAVPRDSLYLMSKADRDDNLLSICIPTAFDYTIPSFSLHYITAVYEYCVYSGDLSLAKEIMPKMQDILNAFIKNIKNGLVTNFVTSKKPGYWNFYEWREGLNGYAEEDKQLRYDAALNCLLSIAFQNMQKISNLLHIEVRYGEMANALNENINKTFYNKEKGLYVNNAGGDRFSELVNALAVLCGAAAGNIAENICRILTSENDLTDVSLSMSCFKYDALLSVDEQEYSKYVIGTIERIYKKMLDAGATSFWEDVGGADEFDKAGSLCHGWSAMPVYYFHILEKYMV